MLVLIYNILESYLINFFFILNLKTESFFFFFFNSLNPFLQNGLNIWFNSATYQFPFNYSFFFTFKFIACIFFLILIRGGTPRYRYDFLTKLGWLKFLGLIIFLFINSIFFFFLF